MQQLAKTTLLLAVGLGSFLGWTGPVRAQTQVTPFTDLPADHWAYDSVQRLIQKGILSGYPDGSFRGRNLVTRYALAVALAKALETGRLIERAEAKGSPGNFGNLSVEDVNTFERLIKEFGNELALVGIKAASAEDQIRRANSAIADLEDRVTALEEGSGKRDRIRFGSGRFRALGYNKSALNGSMDTILNVGVDLDEEVEAHIGLRYQSVFDQIDNESFSTYEAYLRTRKAFGPIHEATAGKKNQFLGMGMALFDRREGVNLYSRQQDMNLELAYFDAFMAHVSTEILGEGKLGFYLIKQDQVAGRQPSHLGVYARGDMSDRFQYGVEFTEYDNDGATPTNRDAQTRSLYVGVGLHPGEDRNLKLRLGYLMQEEDYRGMAVDSDLRWQFAKGRVSPHHDLLQAIRDATPAGVDPDAIPGFKDLQLGVDFQVPQSRWRGWFNLDMLRGQSNALNHSDDDFEVYTLALERDVGRSTELQLRYQAIQFENPNSAAVVDGIPTLVRQNQNNLRAQVVKRF